MGILERSQPFSLKFSNFLYLTVISFIIGGNTTPIGSFVVRRAVGISVGGGFKSRAIAGVTGHCFKDTFVLSIFCNHRLWQTRVWNVDSEHRQFLQRKRQLCLDFLVTQKLSSTTLVV
ncbi:hypothetical protein SAMD00079811_76970 (plasmid) [Scytonema sp. HK-05]|nr:hypothetical protein NIES2130_39650 [Scytonema sp. HK-05]BAY50068.1 hypothetical protein SAMD00079811_76970 [Scytonema sp. HK-05]